MKLASLSFGKREPTGGLEPPTPCLQELRSASTPVPQRPTRAQPPNPTDQFVHCRPTRSRASDSKSASNRRPAFSIEHPYATSSNQRFPVLPLVGQRAMLRVDVDPSVTQVTCEWQTETADARMTATLALAPAQTSAAAAAALVGVKGTSPRRTRHPWANPVDGQLTPRRWNPAPTTGPAPRVHLWRRWWQRRGRHERRGRRTG